MTAKQSPFFNMNYGWNYGENNWNVGMDDNIKKMSFLLDKSVISQISSIPASPLEGDSYILSSSGVIYVFIDGAWITITPSEGLEVYVRSTGTHLVYLGGQWTTGASSALKVAYIGDSLTQNSTRNVSWANQTSLFLEQLLGIPIITRNVAIGGSTFSDAISTNQHRNGTTTQIQEVIEFAPDIVFVALGVNDSIFLGTRTSAQIIADATTMVNTLKSALPNTKLIYVEEVPHDIVSAGVTPASLVNQDAVPFSHTLVTNKGLSNVRLMDGTYLTTAITGAALTKHQTWGTATTTLRTLFDGYFKADLWKMARMGCVIDGIHIDELGHCLWAWSAITYLADSGLSINGVDLTKLQFANRTTSLWNIDQLWEITKTYDYYSDMPLQYRGQNMFERTAGWVYKYPRARMDYSVAIKDGSTPVTVNIVNVAPNSPVWVTWDTANFVNSNRSTTRQGNHLQTFIPSAAFPTGVGAGNHGIWYAIQNPDGSYDMFTGVVNIQNEIVSGSRATALKYDGAASIPTSGTITTVQFTSIDHDNVGVGTTWDRFVIPSSINGKKFRLRAGLRGSVPLGSSNGSVDFFAGFRKNGQSVAGDTAAAGRGLVGSRQLFTNVSGSSTTFTFDINLSSAELTAVTSDYYELICVCTAPTATGNASITQNIYTWMELELVG